MSKSLKRVQRHLQDLGITPEIRRMAATTRSAEDAANAVGVTVNQIVKSVVLRGGDSDEALLFLTAGGNQVDLARASALLGAPIQKADAAFIRAETGFAIGGVSPFGHLKAIRTFMDPALMGFDKLWAAAGTPFDVFEITPEKLAELTGAQVVDFT